MNPHDPSPVTTIARLEQAARRHDVPVEGGAVAWRRFGKGPPLVLVHGGHGSWLHWARNVEALSNEFELFVPDLPGYGDSAFPVESTLEALVASTRRSLDALIGADTPIALAAQPATRLQGRRAHVKSLAAASLELHVTQPAVSRQVGVLEGYLGAERAHLD